MIPARKSGWIEILAPCLMDLYLDSRSQERVDRNIVTAFSIAVNVIPARKSGWIEISQESRRRKSNIPARKSGWIEMLMGQRRF